ncbi:Glycoside hydrolase family 24 protein [Mycena chlorophos]|uniref:Glycoside hydrolase family 24 protein n=1 Tax=Mycena chlorophos TaxID=658473 RepID=A0A8H6WAH7_MYCCL|nr:Glycoside hydrolase family 24 protein [Mycena chlorophos]
MIYRNRPSRTDEQMVASLSAVHLPLSCACQRQGEGRRSTKGDWGTSFSESSAVSPFPSLFSSRVLSPHIAGACFVLFLSRRDPFALFHPHAHTHPRPIRTMRAFIPLSFLLANLVGVLSAPVAVNYEPTAHLRRELQARSRSKPLRQRRSERPTGVYARFEAVARHQRRTAKAIIRGDPLESRQDDSTDGSFGSFDAGSVASAGADSFGAASFGAASTGADSFDVSSLGDSFNVASTGDSFNAGSIDDSFDAGSTGGDSFDAGSAGNAASTGSFNLGSLGDSFSLGSLDAGSVAAASDAGSVADLSDTGSVADDTSSLDGLDDTSDAGSVDTADDTSAADDNSADSSLASVDSSANSTSPSIASTTNSTSSFDDSSFANSTSLDDNSIANSTDSSSNSTSIDSPSNSTSTNATTPISSFSATQTATSSLASNVATGTSAASAAAASNTSALTCGGAVPNAATISLIEKFEGFVASPAPDPIGLPTVGFGHKCTSKSCAIPGFSFPLTQDTAVQLLNQDLATFVSCVNSAVSPSVVLTDNQVGALSSFAFNLGCGTLKSSTLLSQLNAGQDPNTVAAAQIPRFNKAGGKVLSGLVSRRAAEVALFQTPSTVQAHPC